MNILVTGGASGLGASIVKALAANAGHKVYFTYARSSVAALEMEKIFPNTKAIACDFSDAASVDRLIDLLAEIDIDVLVNNAYGGISKEHFYKTDPALFSKSFELNVVPTLKITQGALKIFRKKKFGKIVNIITSYVIGNPPGGLSDYVANKAYLLSMSKSWATEYIRFNISTNNVSPSLMLTNLTADTDERIIEQMQQDHPLKKLLSTEEAAQSVVYLVNAPQHVNGTNIVINAGATIA